MFLQFEGGHAACSQEQDDTARQTTRYGNLLFGKPAARLLPQSCKAQCKSFNTVQMEILLLY